jgi:formamidopyrimidine-DNA glycosylase
MPELPEVETVRRGLEKAMVGRRINQVVVRRSDLRRPLPQNFSDMLTGREITQLDRRAKYLLIYLDSGNVVLVHLGMSGRMVIEQGTEVEVPARKHEHIAFSVGNGTVVRFSDPRRFGLMDLTREEKLFNHPLLKSIGPEPLGEEFTAASLMNSLKGRKTTIKSALLDQRIVAGLGNIYVCEGLFIASVSPRRITQNISISRVERLVSTIKEVLRAAINAGGSTLQDHVTPTGEMGYFQYNFKVYGREGKPCETCMRPVKRIVQAGRSTFFCARCQR